MYETGRSQGMEVGTVHSGLGPSPGTVRIHTNERPLRPRTVHLDSESSTYGRAVHFGGTVLLNLTSSLDQNQEVVFNGPWNYVGPKICFGP